MLIYQDAYLGIKIVPCCYLSLFLILRSLVLFFFNVTEALQVWVLCLVAGSQVSLEEGSLLALMPEDDVAFYFCNLPDEATALPFSTSAAVERGELCSDFTCRQHGAHRAPVCSEWPSFGRPKLREVCLGESINSWSGTGIGSSISKLSWMLWDVVCKLCNSLKWEDELKGCDLQSFKSVQLQM